MACSHRRRGRDKTILSCRVGGVNKPLLECSRCVCSQYAIAGMIIVGVNHGSDFIAEDLAPVNELQECRCHSPTSHLLTSR